MGMGVVLLALHLVVLWITAKWARKRGIPAAQLVVLIAVGMAICVPVVLWSPTLFIPAVTLATWLSLDWADGPKSWKSTLLLGLVWGATLDAYLAGGGVLLALAATAAVRGRGVHALVVLVVAGVVGVAISPDAWLGTAVYLRSRPMAVAGLFALTLAVAGVARRFPAVRTETVMAVVGSVLATGVCIAHLPESRYWTPVWPALALIAARAGRSWPRLVQVLAVFVALGVASGRNHRGDLHYREVETLAHAMTDAGIGWPHSTVSVHGPWGRDVGLAATIFLPTEATAANGLVLVPAGRGTHEREVAEVQVLSSRIDWENTRACTAGAGQEACRPLVYDWLPPGDFFPLATRLYARGLPISDLTRNAELQVPFAAGTPEHWTLHPQFEVDLCPWHFADGSTKVLVPATATTIRLSRGFHPPCPPPWARFEWLPPWTEEPLVQVRQPISPRPGLVPATPRRLKPGLESAFSAVATQLSTAVSPTAEPDIRISSEEVVVSWPRRAPVVLGPADAVPWFAVLARDATSAVDQAVESALAGKFHDNPWIAPPPPAEVRAPPGRRRAVALPLALLALMGLAGAGWQLGRRR